MPILILYILGSVSVTVIACQSIKEELACIRMHTIGFTEEFHDFTVCWNWAFTCAATLQENKLAYTGVVALFLNAIRYSMLWRSWVSWQLCWPLSHVGNCDILRGTMIAVFEWKLLKTDQLCRCFHLFLHNLSEPELSELWLFCRYTAADMKSLLFIVSAIAVFAGTKFIHVCELSVVTYFDHEHMGLYHMSSIALWFLFWKTPSFAKMKY